MPSLLDDDVGLYSADCQHTSEWIFWLNDMLREVCARASNKMRCHALRRQQTTVADSSMRHG